MLSRLTLSNTGPAPAMELNLGSRLNVLTGATGLGKTFVLDCIWWALTHTWPAQVNPQLAAGRMALPADRKKPATISAVFSAAPDTSGVSASSGALGTVTWKSTFNARAQSWTSRQGKPVSPANPASPPNLGLVFSVMADGCFAVWDPVRTMRTLRGGEGDARPAAYVFSPAQVWNGLRDAQGVWLSNGLIWDWANWQKEDGQAFARLKAVLAALSPSAEEKLVPGRLVRISLKDARDIPTVRMPYGQDVPVLHAASGMRRLAALAWLLVWCLEEHGRAAELLGEEPAKRAVLCVDDVEAHLHPGWQRTIVPALMKAMDAVGMGEDGMGKATQLVVTTHSPLIMASVETLFDSTKDAWFDLKLTDGRVALTKQPLSSP